LHSWRTLILPYLEHKDTYVQTHLSEPWNSPANAAIFNVRLSFYRCTSQYNATTTETSYVLITGPKAVFHGDRPARLSEITHGPSNTILAVELASSGIAWAEPKDLTEDEFLDGWKSRKLASAHEGGMNVLMADGSVRFLSDKTDAATLRRLIEKADGKPLPEGSLR
jgi:prepilin-type processing-associated H-X9-DG protein